MKPIKAAKREDFSGIDKYLALPKKVRKKMKFDERGKIVQKKRKAKVSA